MLKLLIKHTQKYNIFLSGNFSLSKRKYQLSNNLHCLTLWIWNFQFQYMAPILDMFSCKSIY